MQAQSIIHTHGGEIVMLSNVPIKQEHMMEHNHVYGVFLFLFLVLNTFRLYILLLVSAIRKLVKSI